MTAVNTFNTALPASRDVDINVGLWLSQDVDMKLELWVRVEPGCRLVSTTGDYGTLIGDREIRRSWHLTLLV